MNKKQLMIELAMPIVFMLVAVYVIVKAIPMESEGVFPIMSAGVLLLCAVYLFVEILIKHQQVVKLEGVNLKMVGVTLLALAVYVFLLKKIGYIIDTFALCFFIIRSLGYKKTGVTLLCSALSVACVFFIFIRLLHVDMKHKPMYKTFRVLSLLIYVSHMLFAQVFIWLMPSMNSFLFYVLTIGCSFLFSYLIYHLSKHYKLLKQLY